MAGEEAGSSVAWRIGRYDIVARLASGGMAEILLARLLGPSGFQRALVIKRILPHLAAEKSFREMFLDEARIVASIRHPNVVQVNELGADGEDLFLAMEYIEGESTAGLMRRLHLKGETLPRGLAAYIVAEACAGLHAAHELTDASGKVLSIVHRDASPHNLFISYNGVVKVLDFGIATAADRIARTEAGQFKGKFEYASPEQCKGVTLDRRSDVFALGAVLWELTTGRRIFKRGSNLEMLKAICEQPIPPPRSVDPAYPEALSRVVMRALSRSRRRRYQTALEMRQDLLAVARELSPSLTPEDDLAALMRRLFADRMQEKADTLRRVQQGTTVARLPDNDADLEVELPIVVTVEYDSLPPTEGEETASGTESATDSDYEIPVAPRMPSDPELMSMSGVSASGTDAIALESPHTPRARKVPLAAAVGVALFAVVAVVVGVTLSRPRGAASDPVAMSNSVAVAPPPPVDPPPPEPPASTSAEPPAEPPPKTVVVHVDTTPRKAQVFVAGVRRGVTPLDLDLGASSTPVKIELRHAGYTTLIESVVPDANQKLKLNLVRAGAAAPAKPTASAPYHRFD